MKTYKKIDIFINGKYLHSTKWYKTCKEAIASALKRELNLLPDGTYGKLTANFDKAVQS